jgi:hypothetical protein
MSDWSYGGNLEDSPRDQIRFLLGDVTEDRYSPTDSELDYWVGVYTSVVDSVPVVDVYGAAAEVARSMANRYMRLARTKSIAIGGMSLETDYQAQADAYNDLVARLLDGKDNPAIGGVSKYANGAAQTFSVGMMDNPNAY